MSGDSHESLIKTPKQLVTVLVLAFVVPIVLIVLLSQLATSGRVFDKNSPAMSPEEVGKRIKPVANVAVAGVGGASKQLKTGEQVFQAESFRRTLDPPVQIPHLVDRRKLSEAGKFSDA